MSANKTPASESPEFVRPPVVEAVESGAEVAASKEKPPLTPEEEIDELGKDDAAKRELSKAIQREIDSVLTQIADIREGLGLPPRDVKPFSVLRGLEQAKSVEEAREHIRIQIEEEMENIKGQLDEFEQGGSPEGRKTLKNTLLKDKLRDLFQEFETKPVTGEEPFQSESLGSVPSNIANDLFSLHESGIEIKTGPIAKQDPQLEARLPELLEFFDPKLEEAASEWYQEEAQKARDAIVVGNKILAPTK